jgi:F subunit of K+-transporting ATPase (Potass_KdpF)
MSPFDWISQNLGLVCLTVISIVLTLYLGYSMIHPERF